MHKVVKETWQEQACKAICYWDKNVIKYESRKIWEILMIKTAATTGEKSGRKERIAKPEGLTGETSLKN